MNVPHEISIGQVATSDGRYLEMIFIARTIHPQTIEVSDNLANKFSPWDWPFPGNVSANHASLSTLSLSTCTWGPQLTVILNMIPSQTRFWLAGLLDRQCTQECDRNIMTENMKDSPLPVNLPSEFTCMWKFYCLPLPDNFWSVNSFEARFAGRRLISVNSSESSHPSLVVHK